MGMPPAESGRHSTFPLRFCGGNLDCKELVAGSILYLPIAVEGMLDVLERRGYNRKEALMLASLTVDLRVSQIVNGTKGVHAILPHDVLNDCPPSNTGSILDRGGEF